MYYYICKQWILRLVTITSCHRYLLNFGNLSSKSCGFTIYCINFCNNKFKIPFGIANPNVTFDIISCTRHGKKEAANYNNLLLGNISLLDQSRKWGYCPIFANCEIAAVLESLEGLFLGLT